jgi:hypothetical protein
MSTPTHLLTADEKLNPTKPIEMRNNSTISKLSDTKICISDKNQSHQPSQTDQRTPETHPQQKHQVLRTADIILYSVHLNDSVQFNHKSDVFRGVNRKRNARYFLSAIDRESSRNRRKQRCKGNAHDFIQTLIYSLTSDRKDQRST